MPLLPAIALISLAITLLGAVALLLGWHRRRVGDHPFCRRCGFDLFTCSARPPLPLCFRVVLRDGAREWTMGSAVFDPRRFPAGSSMLILEALGDDAPPPKSATLDVVLRPDPTVEEFGAMTDAETYWGREVVLRDVPVRYR